MSATSDPPQWLEEALGESDAVWAWEAILAHSEKGWLDEEDGSVRLSEGGVPGEVPVLVIRNG